MYDLPVSRWDEPEIAPPHRKEDGEAPTYRTWPIGHQPSLQALVDGRWRSMTVTTRIDYPDGRVAYQGDIYLPMPGRPPAGHNRVYWWPQKGRLRVEQRPDREPE